MRLGDVPFAVVDVETTGLARGSLNRIVEVAVVHLDKDLSVDDEYVTLVNPQRDIGATHIHGIRTSDVLEAPLFEEVAGDVAKRLRGRVVVGHNVTFDLGFLSREYLRLGAALPNPPYLCTRRLPGTLGVRPPGRVTLACACEHFGVTPEALHTALGDARTTARLFALLSKLAQGKGLASLPALGCNLAMPSAGAWPNLPPTGRTRHRPHLSEEASRKARELRSSDLDDPIVQMAYPPVDLAGRLVCFTGTLRGRIGGRPVGRLQAEEIARCHGAVTHPCVLRSMDYLVVADPCTQSEKSRKARHYGVRTIPEEQFWRSVGWPID